MVGVGVECGKVGFLVARRIRPGFRQQIFYLP